MNNIEKKIYAEIEAGLTPALDQYLVNFPDQQDEVIQIFWEAMLFSGSNPESGSEGCDDETLESVRRLMDVSRTKASDLTGRIREIGVSPNVVATSVNIPNEIILMIQRRTLTEIPEKLVVRLARTLKQSTENIWPLVSAQPPNPEMASHYRAVGTPRPVTHAQRAFGDVLAELRSKGKLNQSQIEDWMSEQD